MVRGSSIFTETADLLPTLKILKVVDDNEYRQLELQSSEALFEQASSNSCGIMSDEERAKPLNRVWTGSGQDLERSQLGPA